jgi:tetratricopeptide (TPR) repeat protein
MADNDKKDKQSLGRVDVRKKALRIQDLGDKAGTAVKMFEAAQSKFEKGEDSSREWKNIIKLLNLQIKDMRHFQAVAHHNIGIIHAGRAEFRKAEEWFKKAVEIDPDYAMAYYNLAVVYRKLDDKEKARKNYLKAKELGYAPS